MQEIEELTKAIIVGVNTGNEEYFSYQFTELANLCEARGIEVVDNVIQNLPHPNNKSYVGSGKLTEIATLKDAYGIDLIVVLDELSPVQLKNMEDALNCEVIDRTMLILEIFQLRAKTKEAILQVEIANLKYMLPRLVGSYTNLSRIGGGGGGGAGARRGSGETKLEEDRRHIEVFVKNMLFATLETSTRSIKLPTNQEFLITDTVGFVSNLPHHLIESFKSTLEEIKEADLIVHVVDASSPYAQTQIATTIEVLNEIGVIDIPTVYALNKVDLVKNKMFLPKVDKDAILISNETNEGIKDLIEYIKNSLFNDEITCKLLLPYDKGDIFTTLKEKAHVHNFSYENNGIVVEVTLSRYLYNLYNKYLKE